MEDDGDDKDNKRQTRNLSEKKRRDQFNSLVTELCNLISNNTRKMDKSTILRSTISFLKNHNELTLRSRAHDVQEDWKPGFLSNEEFTYFFLEAFEGFIMVFSTSGQIQYASESITSLLGHKPAEIVNKNIYDMMHKEDQQNIFNLLQRNAAINHIENQCKEIEMVRFQCHIRRGCLDFREEVSYDVVHFFGHFRTNQEQDNERDVIDFQDVESRLLFVCIGGLYPPKYIRDVSLVVSTRSEFTSRHSLEWKFLFLDHRAPPIIGYLPFEVLGTSGYDYYHFDDLEKVITCHEALMQKGELTSCFYRFLTKGQQWIWLQSRFYITYHQWNSKPEFIVCTHRVVSYADAIETKEELDEQDTELIETDHVVSMSVREIEVKDTMSLPYTISEVNNEAYANAFPSTSQNIMGQNSPFDVINPSYLPECNNNTIVKSTSPVGQEIIKCGFRKYETRTYKSTSEPLVFWPPRPKTPRPLAPHVQATQDSISQVPVSKVPVFQTSAFQTSAFQTSAFQASTFQVPASEIPVFKNPIFEDSAFRVPESKVPVSQAAASQIPVSQDLAFQFPASQVPASQVPVSQVPVFQTSTFQVPASEIPASQVPIFQDSAFRVPESKVPVSQAAASQVPVAKVPIFQASASQTPVAKVQVFQGLASQASAFQVPASQVPVFQDSEFRVPESKVLPSHVPVVKVPVFQDSVFRVPESKVLVSQTAASQVAKVPVFQASASEIPACQFPAPYPQPSRPERTMSSLSAFVESYPGPFDPPLQDMLNRVPPEDYYRILKPLYENGSFNNADSSLFWPASVKSSSASSKGSTIAQAAAVSTADTWNCAQAQYTGGSNTTVSGETRTSQRNSDLEPASVKSSSASSKGSTIAQATVSTADTWNCAQARYTGGSNTSVSGETRISQRNSDPEPHIQPAPQPQTLQPLQPTKQDCMLAPQDIISSQYLERMQLLAGSVQPGLLSLTVNPPLQDQAQIQEQLHRKHDELQQMIARQQEELRQVKEQLLLARLGILQPLINVPGSSYSPTQEILQNQAPDYSGQDPLPQLALPSIPTQPPEPPHTDHQHLPQ